MKNVVGIVGSPTKDGNVSTLLNQILKGAADSGAQTKIYHLNEMNIKGCQGCRDCLKEGICSTEDDMEEILRAIIGADAVIIGSPIYIWQVSGQTKVFMDRLYPMIDEKHKPRYGSKKLVMAYTQAAPFKFIFGKYYRYMRKVFNAMGLKHVKDIVVTKCFEIDAVAKNKKAMEKAYDIGMALSLG
ncbi:flavodoxin family protein [Alkaliphilus serpentinus]|uniref:Flavodoxin family protein n=1 Tax=Alkaliphilus serpentinus TaxID=1482731 RepID=A0A833M5S5_9FIRM|nr:flavodoxin family protein [Alkaliphilus serpentinus]KAB3524435.1 flavodoxin family protein [Alkaliphilus serpentinus]